MNEIILNSMPEKLMARLWDTYDWEKAEQELLNNQQELVKAVYAGNDEARIGIQKRIVRTTSAKMLAVRKVCSSDGATGTDRVKWVTSAEKYRAAMSLTSKDYHAMPYRHIIIEPKNGKKRHINIPTYYDKAMQVLYSYSLNPVAEANGERKSFAFRAGRSMQDVNEYIKEAIQGKNCPNYVITTDVKACYRSISHKWLLKNIPMDTKVLKEFLTAGYVFNGEIFPMDEYGISLGGNISPILGNMTLDGMQKSIYDRLYKDKEIDYANGNMIRFADDIFITVRTKEDSVKVLEAIKDFLAERGLRLSEQKTKIVSLDDGFDFLSRHYSKKNGVVMVTPSENAITRFQNDMEELILNHKGSQKSLIEKVNNKITGWASYHKVSDAYYAFRQMDVFISATLLKLCETKHPNWNIQKILEKYWYRDYNGEHVYALKDRAEIRVKKLSDTLIVEHKKVKTNANPYLDADYLEYRSDEKDIYNVSGKYRAIWNRQKGRCHYCGKPILADHKKDIVQLNLAFGNRLSNLAYIHSGCKNSPVEYAFIDTTPICENDIISLIKSLDRGKSKKGLKFAQLGYYFQKSVEPFITLTFREIEDIIGETLCKSAYSSRQYWCRKDDNAISKSWLANGYNLYRVHLDKHKIVFHRSERKNLSVDIPDVFLVGKIPSDAKFELENYFIYIRKKYGL